MEELELQHYELMFIVPGSLAEDVQPEILSRLKNTLVDKYQAQNLTSEDLGRRKLAYPIKNQRHGFYFVYQFDFAQSQTKSLERDLKLDHNVLRYLLIKKTVKSPEEIAQQEKLKVRQIKKKIAQAAKVEKEENEEDKATKKKISLEDLDKRLDEILGEEIK